MTSTVGLRLSRAARAIATQLKAAARRVSLRWGTTSAWSWSGPTYTTYNGTTSSDPQRNSICQSVVSVIARTFPESPVHVLGPAGRGKTAPVEDHPLSTLVAQPNAHYGGEQLWRATIADWYFAGNAYWFKRRSEAGRPVELWWLPAGYVEPASDDDEEYVQYYRYTVGGKTQKIDPKDVVHFRNGLDPANPRRGRSPFASVLAEVFQDNEAARFGQALLANMGIPGVVISPETDLPPGPDAEEEAEAIKQRFKERFGGDRRGDALVLTSRTKVQVLSFTPEQMDLTALRRVPEERISAVVGVSAMVVGLGVGYEHSIYNNYDVAYQALYETNLIPTQRLFAGELQVQLLPDLGNKDREKVAFDNSQVRVLQPDLDALWKRVGGGVNDAIITPNEAREVVGLPPLQGADVLYVKMTVTPTPPAELVPPEPEPEEEEEPALEQPTALRALPPPKSRRRTRTKGAGSAAYAASLTRLRARAQPRLERELAAYLADQQDAVVTALAAQQKAISWADILDAGRATRTLARLLRPWYTRVLGAVHALTEDAVGASFDLDDEVTRAFLARAGALIPDITETTRSALASTLQEGQAAGEGVSQLAERVRRMTEFDRPRATLIARTELATASQYASVASFRASGVVRSVLVLDGDSDPDCASANGQTWSFDEAERRPIQHPNCVRSFAPAFEDASSGATSASEGAA